MTAHLVIIGFDEIVSNKYMSCIEDAYSNSFINGYSIIDLKGQESYVFEKLSEKKLQPHKVVFISSPPINTWSKESDFDPILKEIRKREDKVIVYIATELKAHEGYLRYCMKEGIKCLVEKPVFAPLKNGIFEPSMITKIWNEFEEYERRKSIDHSIMTLSRYHPVYNDIYMENLREMILETSSPITSLHLRHSGGVWNLYDEYFIREDHPYKYGYGILMHGGYHYLDLFVQILSLNKIVFPNTKFEMIINSFAAYPTDQQKRIPDKYFEEHSKNWNDFDKRAERFGENDIVTSYCLRFKESQKVLTLGTISLEQTTSSVRNWKKFPEGVYNKNGRTSFVEVDTQLSTLHSSNVTCFDIPLKKTKEVERIDAFARIINRTNASLLPKYEYVTESTYEGLFHSESNKKLMSNWLESKEERSRFSDHKSVMMLVEAIGKSIRNEGESIIFEF